MYDMYDIVDIGAGRDGKGKLDLYDKTYRCVGVHKYDTRAGGCMAYRSGSVYIYIYPQLFSSAENWGLTKVRNYAMVTLG